MIAPFDQQARDAFCVGLREEPSRPNATQELDPNDILEVQDVAEALAQAESRLRASDLDVLDARLPRRPRAAARATDDAAGPARHSPVRTVEAPRTPPPSPAPSSSPPAPEDDAFFHPMGRIRTLADVTIEGYRPEPTVMVRIRERRGKLSWVVAGILVALAVLTATAMAVETTVSAPVSVAVKPAHLRLAHVHAAAVAPAPSIDVKSLPTTGSRGRRAR